MSSTEAHLRYPTYDLRARRLAEATGVSMSAQQAPIVPGRSTIGSSLLGVIAVMSFLASVTLGAVVLIRTAATEWQGEVGREVTIQIRPMAGRDIEADIARASLIARATHGVRQVRPFSKEESTRLLEPWLGGLGLDELPVPRLIVVNILPGVRPDMDALGQALASQVPGATLDDHRGWVEQMRAVTRTAVTAGLVVLALMMFATILLVVFATRGAMATNHSIVEVLHLVGAKNRYIAGQFQRHFLLLGLKGALLGGGSAMLLFALAGMERQWLGSTSGEHIRAIFGNITLPPEGYAGVAGIMILIAAVAALTSRWTVHRTLNALD
jgi:cell division transport system permease protein